jgi:peptidoglycan/xylan/chitin deacetylase (PgdA/CDA1 family)
MYHFVRVNPIAADRLGFDLSVTPDDLAAQLDHLTADGFHSVSLAQVADAMQGGPPLPAKPVVLTFDDGFADFFTTAMPVLRAHQLTATSFVVSGFVGRPNYMTADQVRAASQAGMTIGAHTAHHVDLTTAAPQTAELEIRSSRAELEAVVGHPVLDFAYPSGRVNPLVERLVHDAGFRDAVTTQPGRTHHPATPYSLTRVRVHGGESLAEFDRSLGGA